jgi:GT2 family glycosyltransferase
MAASPHNPLVVAAVAVRDRRELTCRFLDRFAALTHPNLGLVVVDDGSRDGTPEAVQAHPARARLLRGDGSLWWAGATNLAVRAALDMGAAYVLTINDDATFGPDLVERLLAVARARPHAIVGSRLMCSDRPGRVRALGAAARFRGRQLYRLNFMDAEWSDLAARLGAPHPVDTLPGNGVLLPRAVFERVGLYDQRHLPHYHADSDLVLRARRAGFEAVVVPDAVVYDHRAEPRTMSLLEAIASRRSDRYWRAVLTTIWRHGPSRAALPWLAMLQWAPFLLPRPWQRAARSRLGRRRRRHERLWPRPVETRG